MVTLATTTYGYDDRNQLTSVGSATFSYDYAGRRTQTFDGVLTTDYLWDEFSRYGDVVLATNLAETTSFTLANGTLISQTVDDGTNPAVTSYFLTDAIGSTRALTDDVGVPTASYEYNAFGELLGEPDLETLGTDYLYAGQQFDPMTELYSMRARYYDAAIGRFMSRDTYAYDYENPIELNRYVYVHNNPTNWSDPSGYIGNYNYAKITMAVGVVAIVALTPIAIIATKHLLNLKLSLHFPGTGTKPQTGEDENDDTGASGGSANSNYSTLNEILNDTAPEYQQPEKRPTVYPWPMTVQPPSTPQPQPTPTPEDEGCNPSVFSDWWLNTLQEAGGVQPGIDWWDYEQRVTRDAPDTLGGNRARRVPAGVYTVDADGALPATCWLLDGKHHRTGVPLMDKPGVPSFLTDEIRDELFRYSRAVNPQNSILNNIPDGAQPLGLEIRTNRLDMIPVWSSELIQQGFIMGVNARVVFHF